MNKKEKLLKEFKNDYPLNKDYKYRIGTDDGGGTLEIYNVPKRHAHKVRKKIPMKYNGVRTIVFYKWKDNEEE
tara:strand:- start:329 stop:547 length:219 start_codon:yes stop_codon:yes gene_type:complete